MCYKDTNVRSIKNEVQHATFVFFSHKNGKLGRSEMNIDKVGQIFLSLKFNVHCFSYSASNSIGAY